MKHRLVAAMSVAALAAAAPLALADRPAANPGKGHGKGKAHRPAYLLGAAVESIDPTQAQVAAGDFYLGGYGLASGKVANQVPVPGVTEAVGDRHATGVLVDPAFPNHLADGVHVRAVVVGAGKQAVALAQIETQGVFSAYKQGPFGIVDMRRDAAAAIATLHGPAMPAGAILVDSNHTHGGPDTAGVWGGVPTDYLKHVHDQTVKAIVEAYQRMQPVDLTYGVAHAGVAGESSRYPSNDPLLTNQFSNDPSNPVVDDEVRVLQARNRDDEVVATYVNYSAHPTVLDGDNTLVTADYTGPLDAMLSSLGGVGMEQVATLGRTQPARDSCAPEWKTANEDVCKINSYAARVFARVQTALATAVPVQGKPAVAMHSYFVTDPATNAPIVALTYGGVAVGAPIYRAANAPWFTGNVLGAPSFSGRIGNLLISGGPGEMYPQIVQAVRAAVPAQGYLNIGTAGDFLGYIVSPFSAYPEPIRRSILDGNPPPTGSPDCSGGAAPAPLPSPFGCPDPVGNDNYFFNVSHTFGERLMCSFLRGAGEVVKGDKSAYWNTYAECAAFANDYALDPDADTTFPAQPDLSAVLTH
jgi:hypothetical protein